MIQTLKAALSPWNLTLSAVLTGNRWRARKVYEMREIVSTVDMVLLETFNYLGPWDPSTGRGAALYSTSTNNCWNVNCSVSFWLDQWPEIAENKRKFVIGIPFFALTFELADPESRGIRAAADGTGEPGNVTRAAGILSHEEVVRGFRGEKWAVHTDPLTGSYASRGRNWISYDDEYSVKAKAKYVRQRGLGGIFAFPANFDAENFRLLKAVKEALEND